MVRLSVSSLVWLAAGAASSVLAADNKAAADNVVAGAFILECESGRDLEPLVRAVEERGGEVRRRFDSEVFRGVSVQLADVQQAERHSAEMGQMAGVKNVWPIRVSRLAPEDEGAKQPAQEEQEQRRGLGRRAAGEDPESPWNHLMTQVDKLHGEGFTGNGIKIAVVDTGVDYKHPALGGCFGTGCRVAFGDNLARDGTKGDPMDCNGHGTKVAGILAGYDREAGFVGAAPNATLGAYRVLDCNARMEEDDLVAGWLRAFEDGAQIIVSSAAFQGANWAQRPAAAVVARIVASGVPCITALGNLRDEGLFFAANPATGRGVMAVNSFARAYVPLESWGAYAVDGAAAVEFPFEAGFPGRWDREERPVHDVDADYGDDADDLRDAVVAFDYDERWDPAPDCQLSPGNGTVVKDLAGRVALIRSSPQTSNCAFRQRARNAAARGAAHILSWRDEPVTVDARGVKGIVATGITHAEVGMAMARALRAGRRVTVRRTGRLRIETGPVGGMSAFGPTWDLDIKPNVGAPGQSVPVTDKGGRYYADSGTSFAGPLVGGIVALIAEARGTFDPALITGLLMATAVPQVGNDKRRNPGLGDYLYSVAQQGGGLVKAWDAAHATTLVEPAGLAFNDTDHRVPSVGLRITNTAKSEVAYELSSIPAITLYTLAEGSVVPGSNEAVHAAAAVTLSSSSVTLGPGQSVTVDVSAADPEGLDPGRLPLWSGWIAINGSDDTSLTVPYLGLGGSLRSATVMDPYTRSIVRASEPYGPSVADGAAFILPDPPSTGGPGLELGSIEGLGLPADPFYEPYMIATFRLALGSPQVRVDVVPLDVCSPENKGTGAAAGACVPEAIVTELGGIKSVGQLAGYPQHYVQRGKFKVEWNGALASGQFAPPGRYKLVARALAVFGDADDVSHWQAVESPVFTIVYVKNMMDAWARLHRES